VEIYPKGGKGMAFVGEFLQKMQLATRNDAIGIAVCVVVLTPLIIWICTKVLLMKSNDSSPHVSDSEWFEAAKVGETKKLSFLLQQYPSLLNTRAGGETALILAAESGRLDCVQLLIKAQATLDLKFGGRTALMAAAANGHEGCVKALVEAGATVNVKGPIFRTALMLAARNGHVGCVRALLKAGADIDVQDNHGYSALMWVAFFGYWTVCKLLLEHGANRNLTNDEGKTALMLAMKNANGDVASLLASDEEEAARLSKGCFRKVYVCTKTAFLKLERFVNYEEGTTGPSPCVVPYSGKGKILYCSHRWFDRRGNPPHPDNKKNIKIQAIQNTVRKHPNFSDVDLIWIDFLCVPQNDLDEMFLSINSLPYIIQQCSHFLVLVGECGVVLNDKGQDEASFEVYRSRAWRRLECLSFLAPRQDHQLESTAWKCNINTGAVEHIDLGPVSDFNPFEGVFPLNNIVEKHRISLIVFKVCCKFAPCPEIAKIKQDAYDNFPSDRLRKRYEYDL